MNLLREISRQTCQCSGAVADLIFLLQRHFGKGAVKAIGYKYRIIAETTAAAWRRPDSTLDHTFELMFHTVQESA